MPVYLPTENWLDLFRFIPRPGLGNQISLTNRRFAAIANIRILGPESERSVDHLVIYGDDFYVQDATKDEFIRKCTPKCSPFTNIRIKRISVYCNVGPNAAKFLNFLNQPCVIHLDGSRFSQQFGVRAWPSEVQKVCVAKTTTPYCDDNGRSLFDIFAKDQALANELMNVPLLECDLSEPDYNGHLLMWLNNDNHWQKRSRTLVLKGGLPKIEQFLRDVRQNFAGAIESQSYNVEIVCHGGELWTGWMDQNWRTREQLTFKKMNGQKNKYFLKRTSTNIDYLDLEEENAYFHDHQRHNVMHPNNMPEEMMFELVGRRKNGTGADHNNNNTSQSLLPIYFL